jgi:hypothetical protein
MHNFKWFATAAAGALILAGVAGGWTASSTQAIAPTPELSQINPLQMMTTAKDLPTPTYQDHTFVF